MTHIPETPWNPTASQATNQATTKPVKPLTRKQAIFVQHIIDNPKTSHAEAARVAYNLKDNSKSNSTARTIAAENMAKPSIQLELAKHSDTAELVLIDMMTTAQRYGREGGRDGAAYTGHAITAANTILDRVHGKATQRIESQSKAVVLNIDLTGVATPEK